MSGRHEVNRQCWTPVEQLDEVHFYCRQEEIENLRRHSADKDSQISVLISFENANSPENVFGNTSKTVERKNIIKIKIRN